MYGWAWRVGCRCVLVFILSSAVCLADDSGVVDGRVMNAGGQPVPGAVVEIVGHGQRWKTDDSGNFEAPVPSGDQRLMVTSTRYGVAVTPVNVAAGEKKLIGKRVPPLYKNESVVSTRAAGHNGLGIAAPDAGVSPRQPGTD